MKKIIQPRFSWSRNSCVPQAFHEKLKQRATYNDIFYEMTRPQRELADLLFKIFWDGVKVGRFVNTPLIMFDMRKYRKRLYKRKWEKFYKMAGQHLSCTKQKIPNSIYLEIEEPKIPVSLKKPLIKAFRRLDSIV